MGVSQQQTATGIGGKKSLQRPLDANDERFFQRFHFRPRLVRHLCIGCDLFYMCHHFMSSYHSAKTDQ